MCMQCCTVLQWQTCGDTQHTVHGVQGLTYYLIVYWMFFFRDLPLSAPFEIFGMIFLSMCVVGVCPPCHARRGIFWPRPIPRRCRIGQTRTRARCSWVISCHLLLRPMHKSVSKRVSGGKQSAQVPVWCI